MLEKNFNFQPSKIYLALIVVVFSLALFVVAMLSISFFLKGFFVLLITGYGYYIFYRYGVLRGKKSIIALTQRDDAWELTLNSGVKNGQLRGDSTITSLISVLRFDVMGEYFPLSCIVFRDSLPPDGYRKLMITVRLN